VPSREQWKPVLILGSMLAVNFVATFIALQLGGTGKTAVLVYTMPFWVLVFARLALHERLNRLQVLAVIFALAGLTWLVEPWNLQGGVLGTLAMPVIGVLAAWIHLGDRPTPTEALGMALVAVGLALLAWAGLRVKPTA
jgi:drug/metabolite transporter (DMT)-like permease